VDLGTDTPESLTGEDLVGEKPWWMVVEPLGPTRGRRGRQRL
jgi:hypothetical protein